MIDKKFVAIVLAMGLIVSISCVFGQDKYAQDLAAREQGDLLTPSFEQPVDQAEVGSPPSLETPASDQNLGTTTYSIVFYWLYPHSSSELADSNILATIDLADIRRQSVATLKFYKDGATLPENRLGSEGNYLAYYYSQYDGIVDMLEGDGVVFLIVNADRNYARLVAERRRTNAIERD